MSERNGHLQAIDPRPYVGIHTTTQAIEVALEQKAARIVGERRHGAWNGMAITVLSLMLGVSVGVNVHQSHQGVRVEPYVVYIDQFGQERPALRLVDELVKPEQSVIMAVLINWLELVRPISNDPAVLGKNWTKADDYMSNAMLQRITTYRSDQKARQEQGLRVELTQPPTLLPIAGSTRSYTAEWEEIAYNPQGQPVPYESGRWKATITVADFQSKAAQDEKLVRRKQGNYRNLLGIVVDDVQWSGRPLLSQLQTPMPQREGQ
jgi:type IV secretory pathway TrbF-like protein